MLLALEEIRLDSMKIIWFYKLTFSENIDDFTLWLRILNTQSLFNLLSWQRLQFYPLTSFFFNHFYFFNLSILFFHRSWRNNNNLFVWSRTGLTAKQTREEGRPESILQLNHDISVILLGCMIYYFRLSVRVLPY